MKQRIGLLFFLLLVTAAGVGAQDRGFGLGVLLGEPTGVSFKQWLGGRSALSGAAAWSFGHDDSFHVHCDYLIHDFKLIPLEGHTMAFTYGIGARLKNAHDVHVGVRIPVGVTYIFEDAPVDIFIELAPVFDLVPRTDLFFNGGIGVRYYF